MNEENHMIEDVQSNVKRLKNYVDMHITEYAEQNAEVYVSSTLGMEDGDEKQNKKNEYIELFISEIKKIL